MRQVTLRWLLIGCCVVSACKSEPVTSAPQAVPEAGFVLPGPFSQRTTIADLQARFGKSNVKITRVPDGTGEWRSGVTLFPDDSERRAYVTFHDAKALTDLASIAVRDRNSRWRGKHGVYVGMPFAELRKLNGKPFYFSGFDPQQQGQVLDQWSPSLSDDDATLGAFDVGEGDHMYFGVELGVRAGASIGPADLPRDGGSTSSDDPNYPRLAAIIEVTGISASTSLDDEWE